MKIICVFMLTLLISSCDSYINTAGNVSVGRVDSEPADCRSEKASQTFLYTDKKSSYYYKDKVFYCSDETAYLKSEINLQPSNISIPLSKIQDEAGSLPYTNAVSTYLTSNNKRLLIELISWKHCCFPQPDGIGYKVFIYDVTNVGNISKNEELSKLFGSGFVGRGPETQMTDFDYKSIEKIKNKLKIMEDL